MLRIPIPARSRKLKGALTGTGSGPQERIEQLQLFVTRLLRHERLEGREDRMNETRLYAEQLINLAIQHGPAHQPTMKMADNWLNEKDLVQKLFKVLAPRYKEYTTPFTRIYRLPAEYPGLGYFQAVLELKENPWMPIVPNQRDQSGLLSNVLLSAARQDYYEETKGVNKSKSLAKDIRAEPDTDYSDFDAESTQSADVDSPQSVGTSTTHSENANISRTDKYTEPR